MRLVRGGRRIPISLLALCAVLGPQAALGETVEVFSDHGRYSVSGLGTARDMGAEVILYDLAAPRRLEKELSAGLPGNPEQAKAMAMARFEAIGHEELKRRFLESYGGHIKAVKYRIERYPAMVFDRGKAVVYGVTDLTEGLRRYRAWRDAND